MIKGGIPPRTVHRTLWVRLYYRNLVKKPWIFHNRAPDMDPDIWGVIGPGFLNQAS